MNPLKNGPAPIRKKILLTGILGTVCLLIGAGICIFAKDKMMLLLSVAVFVFSAVKVYSLYKMLRDKTYEVVEGTCIAIVPKPLRKFRKIKIMDDEGNESAMLLGKQDKIQIGNRYRFYFKATNRISLGNDFLDSAASSDDFLGYELMKRENVEES